VLTFPHSLRYRLAWDGDLLAVIHKAVIDRIAQKIAFGERRGQRVRRVGFRREGDVMEVKGHQCLALAGFSLYAARRVGIEDRRNLSQLIHNVARRLALSFSMGKPPDTLGSPMLASTPEFPDEKKRPHA
jgi:hypothetical protein